MNKYLLWFMFMSSSLMGMDLIQPANFDDHYEEDISSQEVEEIALSIYFDQEDKALFNAVFPRVAKAIRDINQVPDAIKYAIKKDLRHIKRDDHRRHSYHSYHERYPDLSRYLSRIVHRSMKEAIEDTQSNLEGANQRKQCYKITSITLGLIGTALTIGSGLIVHFTEGNCPQQ